MKRRPAPLGFRRLTGPESLESRNLMAQVELISSAADGTASNAFAGNPSISSDNRYVAFESTATNLAGGSATRQIYVKDRQTEAVTLVSATADGTPGNAASINPKISRDGKFVVFESTASNLVSGDTNNVADVFRKELATGTVVRVSTGSAGAQGNGLANSPAVSKDGSIVAFLSNATNLTNGLSSAKSRVFLKNLTDGKTTVVSQPASGDANGAASDVSLSADGKFIAFSSLASNLIANDTNNKSDVFRYDVANSKIERVSLRHDGTQTLGDSYRSVISGDGSKVAYLTNDGYVISSFVYNAPIVYRNFTTGTQTRVDAPNNSPFIAGGGTDSVVSMSDDGEYVAYSSTQNYAVRPDNNNRADVFVKRMSDGSLFRANTTFDEREIAAGGFDPAMSPDGSLVMYRTAADPVSGNTASVPRIFSTIRSRSSFLSFAKTSVIYVSGESPALIDSATEFQDIDATANTRWTAIYSLSAGAEASDRFSIRPGTVASKSLKISGNSIVLAGKTIGGFSGGTGTTPFTISLTQSISRDEMTDLLRRVSFSSSTTATDVLTRKVTLRVDDSEGAVGYSATKSIVVRPAAYSPLIVLGGTTRWAPGRGPVVLAPNAGFYYPGRANLQGGTLTVSLAKASSDYRIGIRDNPGDKLTVVSGKISIAGKTIGNIGGYPYPAQMIVYFTTNATQAAVQTVLRNLTFDRASRNDLTNLDVAIQINNGAGNLSNIATKTMEIIRTPVIDLGSTEPVYLTQPSSGGASYGKLIAPLGKLQLDSRSTVEGGILSVGFHAKGLLASVSFSGYTYGTSSTIIDKSGRTIARSLLPNHGYQELGVAFQFAKGTTVSDVEALLHSISFNGGAGPARYELEITFSDSNYAMSEAAKVPVIVNRA